MKNSVALFTVISVITLIFSACQKDNGGGPIGVGPNKVKSYTEDITSGTFGNSVTTYNLSYDANDRITSLISASNPGDKFLFSYPSASRYSMDIYSSNMLVIHEDFFLNSNSLPDSTFQYNNTGDTTTERSIFNAQNQPIKLYEYDYSKITGSDLSNITTYTYDAEGNLIKAEDTDTNIDTYEYYPDLVYIYPVITPSPQPVRHKLIKKHTLTSNGFPVGSATFTYTFDSSDRISTERAVLSDGSIVLKTFTYF